MAIGKRLFQDLVVVELASVLAGPSVGQFFTELGAKVLKVENARSRGDVTRHWKLPSEDKESSLSAYFSAANWGKQSICLDLTDDQAKEAVRQIVAQVDIVLVSFKPGDAEKLGLDYTSLVALNPRLIYGAITGYGKETDRAGYDAVLQAEAGFMYLNGEKNGPALKMPVAMIDLLAAHQLKEGILAALYQREKTNKGDVVEVSLLRTAIASLANQATNYLVAGKAPERLGSEHPNIAPYGTIFKTACQKEVVLAIGDDRQFAALCTVLGDPDLAKDDRFKTNNARVTNREALNQRLKHLIAARGRDELLENLIRQHVPAGAVHTVPEALSQPLAKPQLLFNAEGKPLGVRQIAFTLEESMELSLTEPPVLGFDTWQVLQKWAGISAEQVDKLAQKRVATGPKA